jgi:hypothetical protein
MSETSARTARCSCGNLRVHVTGEPDVVTACNCLACQRRTGSAFGLGAYYPAARVVAIDGAATSYARASDAGRSLDFRFCPSCGTTVYWTLEMRPGHVGIAVGCFGDREFVAPDRVVWTEHRHRWLTYPGDLPAFDRAAP